MYDSIDGSTFCFLYSRLQLTWRKRAPLGEGSQIADSELSVISDQGKAIEGKHEK